MVTIVIQAGGASSRMGQDKALKPFLGRPLIERVIARVASAGDEILVTTNRPEAYAFLNPPLFTDLLPGLGALGGLYTALHAAKHPLVAVVACDMPFIDANLLRAQIDLLEQEGVDVVIPRSGEGLEPLHAIYRRETCLPAVKAALDRGDRKMISWFDAVKVRVMTEEAVAAVDPGFRSFINVNSPEEFRKAEQEASA